jgi:hypothetical protein
MVNGTRVNDSVLQFYRAMFPNREDPISDGPWGPVLIDGLLEGNRVGRDLVNFVLQLESAAMLNGGLSVAAQEQAVGLVRQTALEDCGNVPRGAFLRPRRLLRLPRPWPSPVAVAQRRDQSRDEFERVYRQGYSLGYAAALQSLAGAASSSLLAQAASGVADLVMTEFT